MAKRSNTSTNSVKKTGTKLFRRVFRSTTEVPSALQIDYSSERIDLRGYQLCSLPNELFDQGHITWMQLSQNHLNQLPTDIAKLTNLKMLRLFSNKLEYFPSEIGSLTKLIILDSGKNCIKKICPEIGLCSSLTELNLQWNQIEEIPESFGSLVKLKSLNLYINKLNDLPNAIGELIQLEDLDLSHNKLKKLPKSLGKLENLRNLSIVGNQFTKLPREMSNLKSLRKLDLRCNYISSYPDELCNLSIQSLFLRNNKITKLSKEFGSLSQLTECHMEENEISVLPDSIGNLKNLRLLRIFDNRLEIITKSIGNIENLMELDLSKNKITLLPKELKSLKNLEKLYLSYNRFTKIPSCIGKLEKLRDFEIMCNQIENLDKKVFLSLSNITSLTRLNFNQNLISTIPDELFNITSLETIEFASNRIQFLSENISNLGNRLTFLNVSHNLISTLPKNLSKLKELRRLYLSFNKLQDFDWLEENVKYLGDGIQLLEELVLSGNGIKFIPPFIFQLKNLIHLDLSANKIDVIKSHPNLENLSKTLKSLLLTGNLIEQISDDFSILSSLTDIDLSNNLLKSIPDSFIHLKNLIDVDLSGNQIHHLPPDFRALNNLSQLKLSHNQLSSIPKIDRNGMELIPWLSIEANHISLKYPKKSKYFLAFDSLYKPMKAEKIKTNFGGIISVTSSKSKSKSNTSLAGGSGGGDNPQSSSVSSSSSTSSIYTQNNVHHHQNLQGFSIAWAEMRGRRSDQQDTICVLKNYRGNIGEYFIAVYDGHGGTISSEIVSNCLHSKFAEFLHSYENTNPGEHFDANIPFTNCFRYFQNELALRHVSDGTAVNIVYIRKHVLYVANAGDSRSILFRENGAFPLSVDHKPENPDERKRVEDAGGVVTESKRVNGTLALSRAIGDCDMQPPLTFEPVVTTTHLSATDRFIIIACDGLWDVVSNEKAIQLIEKCATAKEAAVLLRDFAYTLGSSDNISVIVVKLHD